MAPPNHYKKLLNATTPQTFHDIINTEKKAKVISEKYETLSLDSIVRYLRDAIVAHGEITESDLNWLLNVHNELSNDHATLDFPVYYDAKKNILSIKGKPDWYVNGERRSLAIAYMYEHAKNGQWEVPAKKILEATRTPGQKGGAIRMQSLFSTSPDWELYINSPKRGYYCFNI